MQEYRECIFIPASAEPRGGLQTVGDCCERQIYCCMQRDI